MASLPRGTGEGKAAWFCPNPCAAPTAVTIPRVGWRRAANAVTAIDMLRLSLLLTCLAAPAGAFILDGNILRQTGNGAFVKLDPTTGFAVGADTFDDDNLYGFDEDQNITLIEPIRVDIGGCINGHIAAGTVVASHYIFFDSISGVQAGFVDFDAPILGIAAYQDTMAATDYLANTDVHYISLELRGLEDGDAAWIDPQLPSRLWVRWAGSSPGDYIRVFTAESPGAMLF